MEAETGPFLHLTPEGASPAHRISMACASEVHGKTDSADESRETCQQQHKGSSDAGFHRLLKNSLWMSFLSEAQNLSSFESSAQRDSSANDPALA